MKCLTTDSMLSVLNSEIDQNTIICRNIKVTTKTMAIIS